MYILSTIAFVVISYVQACSQASKDAWCAQNTPQDGSYCKFYQNAEVCQFSDVPCGCLEPTCEEVCANTPGCVNGDQGSYCKYWDNRYVCFDWDYIATIHEKQMHNLYRHKCLVPTMGKY